MKNIKTLGPRDAIHCPTPELAKKIVELNGDYFSKFHPIVSTFCYIPKYNSCGSLEWCEADGYTIHQASEFLPSGEDEDADIKRLKNLLNEFNKQPMTFVHDSLTEDQKFFRELVVSIAGEICTASGNDWIDTTIKTAKEIFTAVKQHEAK